jgi:hypothetical protein
LRGANKSEMGKCFVDDKGAEQNQAVIKMDISKEGE